ncbi:hypothetical protein KQX54_005604 [Cotesia glomerata]|uniref:Uncharacterized protein n=1 Tax=Cotesia glomerata TaxID=32391 RepID=A0AAV7HPI6_COTGL|nr:hypothetical protein KQX54_005604 [Cotesia glomerata]
MRMSAQWALGRIEGGPEQNSRERERKEGLDEQGSLIQTPVQIALSCRQSKASLHVRLLPLRFHQRGDFMSSSTARESSDAEPRSRDDSGWGLFCLKYKLLVIDAE